METQDKDLLKSLLRYLLYKMDDGENPVRKVLRRKRIKRKVEVKPKPVSKPDYTESLKKTLFLISGETQPTGLSSVRRVNWG